MGNKVIKVIRKLSGNEITGDVSHPLFYYGTSLSYNIREINAVFDSQFIGQNAVFLINTNQSDILNIPVGDKISVSDNTNWLFYSSVTISTGGIAKAQIDISQIGSFAISAYCPVTDIGDPIQFELGN